MQSRRDRHTRDLGFGKFQSQPALEQDDRHEQPHRGQQRTRVPVPRCQEIIDPHPRELPQSEPEPQQQKNRWQSEFPSDPLGRDTKGKDESHVNKWRHASCHLARRMPRAKFYSETPAKDFQLRIVRPFNPAALVPEDRFYLPIGLFSPALRLGDSVLLSDFES